MAKVMKQGWLIGVMALLMMGLTTPVLAAGKEYFVATNGNDSNAGTLAAPFRTIQKCANVAQAGDTCTIRAGTYREVVTPARSGSAGSPITFRAYAGEAVTISGAQMITGWTQVSGNLYSAPMAWTVNTRSGEQVLNDQVFWGGQMLPEARWPNIPWQQVTRLTSANFAQADSAATAGAHNTTYYDSGLGAVPSGTYTGAKITFAPGWKVVYSTCDVTGQTTSRVDVQCNSDPAAYNNRSAMTGVLYPGAGNYYYLWGTQAALDAPGEWYRNASNGLLYVISPDGRTPDAAGVEARRHAYVLDLRGRSHIVIDGLRFFSGSVRYDSNTNSTTLQNSELRYPWHFQQLPVLYWSHGTQALFIAGNDNVIRDSLLAQSAGTMILMSGRRNRVENNVIFEAGYMGVGAVIEGRWGSTNNPGGTESNLVTQNTIYDAGRVAVQADPGLNITYNDLYRSHLLITDLGTVYSWGTDGKNAVIAYNFVHDNTAELVPAWNYWGGHGIYLDDDTYNYHIYRNIIWNTSGAALFLYGTNGTLLGYPANTPSNRVVEHNTVIGRLGATAKPAMNGQPQVMTGTTLRNNVAVTLGVSGTGLSTASNYQGDGLYVNAAGQNYTPQSYSPLVNVGGGFGGPAQQAPMAPVGAPDVGAIESGRLPFVAGAVLRSRDVSGLAWQCVQQAGGTLDCTVNALPVGRRLPGTASLRVGTSGTGSGQCWTTMNYATNLGTGTCTGISTSGLGGVQPVQVLIGGVWLNTGVTVSLGSTTPTLSGVVPGQGPSVGGTQVTLSGDRFATGLTGYSRPVTVSHTGAPVYNHPVVVALDTAASIAAGRLRADCGDMRFYDAEGVELPHWVERGCGTTGTRVWVQVRFLATGNNTLTVNYGHQQRPNTTNPGSVFVFFDDFADGVVSPRWQLGQGSWYSVQETGGVMRIQGTTTAGNQYQSVGFALKTSELNLPTQFAIESTLAVSSGPATFKAFVGSWDLALYGGGNNKPIGHYSGGWQQMGSSTMGAALPVQTQVMVAYTGGPGAYTVRWFENGNLIDVRATRAVSSLGAGGFQVSPDGVANFSAAFDNVRVRPYVYPEPAATVGAEQAVGIRVEVCAGGTCKPCPNVVVQNAGSLTCTVPSFPEGTVAEVRIYNPDGSTAVLAGAMTYVKTYQVFLPVAARP